jgi:hypothetical protein
MTTLDLILQRFAEVAAVRGLDRIETSVPRLRRRDPGRRLQVVLVRSSRRPGRFARWSAGATISPASSTAPRSPAGSRARPSSRSFTSPRSTRTTARPVHRGLASTIHRSR